MKGFKIIQIYNSDLLAKSSIAIPFNIEILHIPCHKAIFLKVTELYFEKKHNLLIFFLFVTKPFLEFNMISQKLDFEAAQSYPDNGV